MERCPNCAARYNGAPACRRCGMDLSILIRTEQAAERLLAEAARHLTADRREAARRDLTASLALKRTPLAEHLLAFIDQQQERKSPTSGPRSRSAYSAQEESPRIDTDQQG